jgi:hypothetical protein
MIHFSQTTIDGLNHPTSADKRRWLDYLRVQVDISYGRAIVSWLVSFGFRKIDAVMFRMFAHHDQIEDR